MKDSYKRSLYKSLTWRLIGSADTFLVAVLATATWMHAAKLSLSLLIPEILFYFFHERIWNSISWGRIYGVGPTQARSVVKAVTWILIGLGDTVLFSYLLNGDYPLAFKIGANEVFTKMLLYYIHERLWGESPLGRIYEEKPEQISV